MISIKSSRSVKWRLLIIVVLGLSFVALSAAQAVSEEKIAQEEKTKSKDDEEEAEAAPLYGTDDYYYDHTGYGPVHTLDVAAYLGTWYQVYASWNVIYTFQLGANCVTAKYYSTKKDRTIRVLNQVRPFADEKDKDEDELYEEVEYYDKEKDEYYYKKVPKYKYGKDKKSFWEDMLEQCLVLDVNGFAVQSPYIDGALTVTLQPGPIPFGIGTPDIKDVSFHPPGNYWIFELGPIVDGKYQYALVSNKGKTNLFVLTRDVEAFELLYEDEILWKLKKLGFTRFTNRPRKTNQKDCGYYLEDKPQLYDDYYYGDDFYHPPTDYGPVVDDDDHYY